MTSRTAGRPELGSCMSLVESETPRAELLKSMKRTKGVRFNASKRLEKSEKTKTSVIAYASASVIVITILPEFFAVPQFVTGLVALSTVAMSVVILAATLIQNSEAGMVKSDQFHRCALEVNALRRGLLANEAASPEEIAKVANQYNEIMQRYGLNHDPVDYEQYRLEHLDEFPELASKISKNTNIPENSSDKTVGATIRVIMGVTVAVVVASLIAGLESALPDLIAVWTKIVGGPD